MVEENGKTKNEFEERRKAMLECGLEEDQWMNDLISGNSK